MTCKKIEIEDAFNRTCDNNYPEMHVGTVLGNIHGTTNNHSHTIPARGCDGVSKCMMIPI